MSNGCSSFVSDWSIPHGLIPSAAINKVNEQFSALQNVVTSNLSTLHNNLNALQSIAAQMPSIKPPKSCIHTLNAVINDSQSSNFMSMVNSILGSIMSTINNLNRITFPSIPNVSFNATVPVLSLPPEPSPVNIQYPTIPSISDITIPTPPSIQLRQDYPELPSIPTIQTPESIDIFDVELPAPIEIDFQYIDSLFDSIDRYKQEIYSTILSYFSEFSSFIAELKSKIPSNFNFESLLDSLELFTEGDYLEKYTNDTLSQFDHAQNKAVFDLLSKSQNGFSLPPAFILANVRDTISSFRDKRMELFYDYNKHKLTLYSDGLKFRYEFYLKVVSLMKELDFKIFDSFLNVVKIHSEQLQRIIEYTRIVMEMELQTIRAVLEYYKQILEYKLTLFKFAELKLSLNNQLIEVYKTKLSAEMMKLDMYAKSVDAIKTRVDIINQINQAEKLKLDVYSTHLQGLSLLSQLNRDRISLYSEQLRGESLKIETYKSQIQAYQSVIGAKVEEFNGKIKGILADADIKKNQIGLYSGLYDAIRSMASGYASALEGLSRPISGIAQIYSAIIGKETARIQLQSQIQSDAIRVNLASYESVLKEYETATRLGLAKSDNISNILRTYVSVLGNIVSAALSGIHVAAQISATAHDSLTETYSKSRSAHCSEQYIASV